MNIKVKFILMSLLYLPGFSTLWWQTNCKVALAVFLICWGVLVQMTPVTGDATDKALDELEKRMRDNGGLK